MSAGVRLSTPLELEYFDCGNKETACLLFTDNCNKNADRRQGRGERRKHSSKENANARECTEWRQNTEERVAAAVTRACMHRARDDK